MFLYHKCLYTNNCASFYNTFIDRQFVYAFLSNNFYDILNRTFTADSVLSGVPSVFEHSKSFDTKSVFAKDSVNYDQITVSNMHFCHLW